MSEELSYISKDEVQYLIQEFNAMLAEGYDDEFAFHLFQNSGDEIALPHFDAFTGIQIDDYKNIDTTKEYEVSFIDSAETYILLLAKKHE